MAMGYEDFWVANNIGSLFYFIFECSIYLNSEGTGLVPSHYGHGLLGSYVACYKRERKPLSTESDDTKSQ